MAKILHFGAIRSINPGVKKQLDYESLSATKVNASHTIVYFSHSEPDREYMKKPAMPSFWLKLLIFKKLKNYIHLRISAYSWLLKNQERFDIILIRYPLGDFIFPIFSFYIKPFYTIHHTKEIEEIKSNPSTVSKLQLLIEKIQFKLLQKKILGFVGVTNEIAEYQLDRAKFPKNIMLYPNGILTSHVEIRDYRDDKIKLCCICNKDVPWHGLHKIYNEIEESGRQDFEIYFVGNLSPASENLETDNRVHFTGHLNQDKLEDLLSKIDLCVGPFGLDAKGLNEACPLKTRESFQQGIPVMADYRDPCFNSSFPYFLKSKFDIDAAIAFAIQNRKVGKKSIAESSQQYISKEVLYKNLLESLDNSEKRV
ncbi:hypothetical protein [Marinobacter sp. SS13-12]|uniref:hypothetical protein n=1 Tax=Marinobacter sp. SS13-12 TaxID=3050451 RepID=UPI002552E62F|nr:hypothetical protein [Marinobacter sp. SS13-12]MDK8463826.1 hypothetical protein [Marinobacter sp. SS13-12]